MKDIIKNNLLPSIIILISIISIIILLIYYLLTGVGDNGKINSAYQKSVPSKNMQGYTLAVRTFGVYKNKNVSSVVKVTNYKNTNILIQYFDLITNSDESTYLIDNNKVYKENKGKFTITKDKVLYKNTSVYLSSLKKITKIKSSKVQSVDKENYKVYNVLFDKSLAADLTYNTAIEGYTSKEDISGQIWLDNQGYVYRIEYYLGTKKQKLELDATYFGYNTSIKTNLK